MWKTLENCKIIIRTVSDLTEWYPPLATSPSSKELNSQQSPKEHVDQVSANILNIAGRISNYTLENRKCKYTCYFANITGKMEYGYCPKFKRGDNSTSCNTMMFKLWNTGILASYLWKMNGYGVMSRR
jgi:hypothetical protein